MPDKTKKSFLPFFCAAAALALTACGTATAPRLSRLAPPPAGLHQKTLFHDYSALAKRASARNNADAARLFTRKAAAASGGQDAGPLAPADLRLGAQASARAEAGRSRLQENLTADTVDVLPAETAHAQAMYDCWIVDMAQKRPKARLGCGQEWNDAIAALEKKHRAAMAGHLPIAQSYEVYFDWNKTAIRPDTAKTLDRIAAEAKKLHPADVTVTGHADRSGDEAYNEKLAQRRALAVSRALDARGVSTRMIDEKSSGESDPAVPTRDGDKLEANRRVVIDFRK
jgi:OOP family OmpA-OmpF porin